MKKLVGKIEKKEVSAPLTTKNGDRTYKLVTYTIEGLDIGKYHTKEDDDFNIGDNVEANVQLNIKKKDGSTYNTFDKSEPLKKLSHPSLLETVKETSNALTKAKSTYKPSSSNNLPWEAKETPALPANKFKPYDAKGQIKGNSISNGVQIAIARYGKDVRLEHIREAALQVLTLHKEFEDL